MSDGGTQFLVKENSFELEGAILDVLAEAELPAYINYLPTDYFRHSHTPMFRMRIDSSITDYYEELIQTTDPTYQNKTAFMPANITFIDNFFDTAVAM